jgi:hypothetical protein
VGVEERQQDTGASLAIARLNNQQVRGAVVQLLLGIAEVWVSDDDEEPIWWDEAFGTAQCVGQHRAVVKEGAVLLGAVDAEAGTDKWLQPPSFATGQDDPP